MADDGYFLFWQSEGAYPDGKPKPDVKARYASLADAKAQAEHDHANTSRVVLRIEHNDKTVWAPKGND